jgi:hypothetical protein
MPSASQASLGEHPSRSLKWIVVSLDRLECPSSSPKDAKTFAIAKTPSGYRLLAMRRLKSERYLL